jgi:hypothetical protein
MRSVSESRSAFRHQLTQLFADVPDEIVAEFRVAELEGATPPWLDTGLRVCAGDQVTTMLCGRVFLAAAADSWIDPVQQVWSRVGGRGPILCGSRSTNTFTCSRDGNVELGNAIPAEWSDLDGSIGSDHPPYSRLTGGTTVALIRWAHGVDPIVALRGLAARRDIDGLIRREVERIESGAGAPPPGWEHLWYIGPSEVYSQSQDSITCTAKNQYAIICHEADVPLTPETVLSWEWKVDELPSRVAENTLATHDYLSIAVEFDDGLDLTYQWSSVLEPETVYRCPFPHWSTRETHLVVRSGTADLGRWLREERRVYADRAKAIGGANPGRIARVWLIAVSHVQHGRVRCAYRAIGLSDGKRDRQFRPRRVRSALFRASSHAQPPGGRLPPWGQRRSTSWLAGRGCRRATAGVPDGSGCRYGRTRPGTRS